MDIERIKQLIDQRENIDAELVKLIGGTPSVRKPQKCSSCSEEGHTARNCPQKLPAATF